MKNRMYKKYQQNNKLAMGSKTIYGGGGGGGGGVLLLKNQQKFESILNKL